MKKCSRCKSEKDESRFSRCKSRPDGLQPVCKDCNREYMSKRYVDNPDKQSEYYKQYYRDNRDGILEKMKSVSDKACEFVKKTKKESGCKHCGITDHRVLHFHHRDPSQKEFGIGSGGTRSISKIKREMEKCDILCANCHAILHHEEEQNGIAVKRGRPRTF